MSEIFLRSFIKALSWRLFAFIITVIITYLISSNIFLSLSIGLSDTLGKIFFYTLHERIWNRISWGKQINNEKLS